MALRECGYEVHHQIGSAGYFVDLESKIQNILDAMCWGLSVMALPIIAHNRPVTVYGSMCLKGWVGVFIAFGAPIGLGTPSGKSEELSKRLRLLRRPVRADLSIQLKPIPNLI